MTIGKSPMLARGGWRLVRLPLLCAVLISPVLLGCGDKEEPLTIPPFSRPPASIRVGDVLSLEVSLNRAADEQVSVEIIVEQALVHTISLNTSRLTFAVGEQKKFLDITGRVPSEGAFAKVLFTIAENGAKQIYQVKVDP